jgi:hypothetical protein
MRVRLPENRCVVEYKALCYFWTEASYTWVWRWGDPPGDHYLAGDLGLHWTFSDWSYLKQKTPLGTCIWCRQTSSVLTQKKYILALG